MPASFDRCVRAKGKVRTISGPNTRFGLREGEYLPVCILDGKLYRGYKKRKGLGKEYAK